MDVRLPDGTVIKNIPEGTTQQQLYTKLQRNGFKVNPSWLKSAAKSTTLPAATKPSTLATVGRYAGVITRGLAKGVGDIADIPGDVNHLTEEAHAKLFGGKAPERGETFNEVADTAANAVRLPKPNTRGERIAEGVAEAVPGFVMPTPGGKAKAVEEGLKAFEKAGYVLPVSQARPGLLSRIAESVAGKRQTEQALSGRNQAVTDRIVRKALGLKDDAKLNGETMNEIRSAAGQDYERLKSIKNPTIAPGSRFTDEVDKIIKGRTGSILKAKADDPIVEAAQALKGSKTFTVDQALEQMKDFRNEAEKAGKASDKKLAKDYHALANAVENTIEQHLVDTQQPKALIDDFRASRQRIAQSYDVEESLDGQGHVDAVKLAKRLRRKSVRGGMKEAANFGESYPKYAQVPEKTGSKLNFSLVGLGAAQYLTHGIAGAAGGLGAHQAGANWEESGLAGLVAAAGGRIAVQKLTESPGGQAVLAAYVKAFKALTKASVKAGAVQGARAANKQGE